MGITLEYGVGMKNKYTQLLCNMHAWARGKVQSGIHSYMSYHISQVNLGLNLTQVVNFHSAQRLVHEICQIPEVTYV